jgi:hypothetical protein
MSVQHRQVEKDFEVKAPKEIKRPKPKSYLASILEEIKSLAAVDATASSKNDTAQLPLELSTAPRPLVISKGGAQAATSSLSVSTKQARVLNPLHEASTSFPSHTSCSPLPIGSYSRLDRIPRTLHDNHSHDNNNKGLGGGSYRAGRASTLQTQSSDLPGTLCTSRCAQKSSSGTTPLTIDQIVANYLEPHPKLQRGSANQRFPIHSNHLEPKRLNNRYQYAALGEQDLRQEAKTRCLSYEHENLTYLVEIMMINDKVFFERCEEFRRLSIDELLEEVGYQNIPIDVSKRWEHRQLLIRIAEMLAREAVAHYNDLLRAEKVAQQIAHARRAASSNRLSRENYSAKAHIICEQSKEPRKSVGCGNKFSSATDGKGKKVERNRSQHEDSSCSTAKTKSNKRARTVEDVDEVEKKPSKKMKSAPKHKVDSRFNAPSISSVNIESTELGTSVLPSKTRLEKVQRVKEKDPKERAKLPVHKPTRLIPKAFDILPSHKYEPASPRKKCIKRKALYNEDDEDSEEVPSKKVKMVKETKLKGIPDSEKIPGLPYFRYADGFLKLMRKPEKLACKPKPKPQTNLISS